MGPFNNYRLIHKKLYWHRNVLLTKNSQFYSDFAEIFAILPTHGLIILAKFDEDRTKIVNLLLLVYFWASIIFFESVSNKPSRIFYESPSTGVAGK